MSRACSTAATRHLLTLVRERALGSFFSDSHVHTVQGAKVVILQHFPGLISAWKHKASRVSPSDNWRGQMELAFFSGWLNEFSLKLPA